MSYKIETTGEKIFVEYSIGSIWLRLEGDKTTLYELTPHNALKLANALTNSFLKMVENLPKED